ncbi:MAG TPA: Holliday junction branch migration protein RuvA [Vicinamibacterales bacterium]
MIALLRGLLLEKHPNRLIVDVQGVGYDVQVPVSTFYQAGEEGAPVSLRIHTHVREDQIALFGFATRLEHELFERLISVNGIGPKVALAVLSGIEPAEFVRAVQSGDVTRLTRIPGVGRKTAERVTLELRDRLPAVDEPEEEAAPTASHGQRDDVVSALVNLGYQRAQVDRAVDAALKASPDAGFEDLLRDSLRHLSR